MSTMKRRIVYFGDIEWETLRKRAAQENMTISAYIRKQLVKDVFIPQAKSAQAERDAILRKVNRG